MNLPDTINGVFELAGGVATWLNVRRLARDKYIRGVDWRVTFFWFGWGLWNLFYYPWLGQIVSTIGGIILVVGNAAWLILALKYHDDDN